ncbi:MAG: histidine phosphatase family protein [Sphingorhabdus sp.]|uniref:histidine phosphatase family protein n=1 Tax=Sphingorhabdus sp. TaxID=1902408 RepID=UPI003CBA53A0
MSTNGKRLFIARHGETVFNAAGRMQGMYAHTPLTREGCEQASDMGAAMLRHVQPDAPLALISSPAGRTLQTLALVAEELGRDFHENDTDVRLREIDVGDWDGCYYKDIAPDIRTIMDMEHKLFIKKAPGGEDYRDVAERVSEWLSEQQFLNDMLIITHGMTARVLRGILLGLPPLEGFGAPIAPGLAQGSMVMIRDGVESLVIDGAGRGERA